MSSNRTTVLQNSANYTISTFCVFIFSTRHFAKHCGENKDVGTRFLGGAVRHTLQDKTLQRWARNALETEEERAWVREMATAGLSEKVSCSNCSVTQGLCHWRKRNKVAGSLNARQIAECETSLVTSANSHLRSEQINITTHQKQDPYYTSKIKGIQKCL